MSFTFRTTLEDHDVEVTGYWQERDSDAISGPRGSFFVPEEVALLRLDRSNHWQRRILPIDWRENPKLEDILADEAEDVFRDMKFYGGYDG